LSDIRFVDLVSPVKRIIKKTILFDLDSLASSPLGWSARRIEDCINATLCSHSETNDMNAGLVVEVWCKGFWWDRSLGYYYLPLSEVPYMNEVTSANQCNLNRTELPHTSPDMRDTNSNTQQATDTVHQSVMYN